MVAQALSMMIFESHLGCSFGEKHLGDQSHRATQREWNRSQKRRP